MKKRNRDIKRLEHHLKFTQELSKGAPKSARRFFNMRVESTKRRIRDKRNRRK